MSSPNNANKQILDRVAEYYSAKVDEFGPIAKGVDWKNEAGQYSRFEILSRILGDAAKPSIVQIGSGYGAFVEFCDQKGVAIEYTGYDISESMIAHAKARFAGREGIEFRLGSEPSNAAEFAIASGIFNVKFDVSEAMWWRYVRDTINLLARSATKGFAFNCLTGFSDADRMQERLFYPMPGEILDYCLRQFGRKVTLIHDYDLYEFTVLIRK